ncbi:MAG: FAD-binding oxidoreductase [Nitrococcus mobilis]|nr:FAD-binding oxidoreductase [Nitrococcus mobilis]
MKPQHQAHERLIQKLQQAVGPEGVVCDSARMTPYLEERRGRFKPHAAAVVLPAQTTEVAAVVQACAEADATIVPQAGNTGLCGGAAPQDAHRQILLNLERMNRIRAVDRSNFTLTAEAGCVLADVQAAAAAAHRLFPLSYAAEDRCHIGGNLATNAGGMNVLRYGNARELVLGVEVVLADGRIWNGLTPLRKDNSGYDLKDLFIGSEGTLGIITAAVLKLYPRPRQRSSAIIGLLQVEHAIALLDRLQTTTGETLVACEIMGRVPVEFALRHIQGCREPFATPYPWYLLIELTSSRWTDELPGLLRETLQRAAENRLVAEWRVAEGHSEAEALWRIRKSIPAAQKHEGGSIKHDISVPLSRVAEFIERASATLIKRLPGTRPCPFGHIGDGNIHFNLSQPPAMDPEIFLAHWDEFNRIVHDIVADMGGSFAAEHGVGRLKPPEVARYKSAVEIDLMRRLKTALDPTGILNPGVIIPPP